jgi:transcriptional regulator with XRE-family HTH domain
VNIRARIQKVIDEHEGWTLRAVSLRAGSDSLVHKILNPEKRGGIKSPTLEKVEALAKALEVDPAWLAFGREPAPIPSEDELSRMIARAMAELPVGVTYEDYPTAVSSNLREQLRLYQAHGGFRKNGDGETDTDKGDQSH